MKSMKSLKIFLGMLTAAFILTGLYFVFDQYLGSKNRTNMQRAAQADLELLARAQRAFHDQFGFFTTDLASLQLRPKYVFYKFGFLQPSQDSAESLGLTAVADEALAPEKQRNPLSKLDPKVLNVQLLKAARPDIPLHLSELTQLESIDWESLARYCEDCTASKESFKAIAAANLDDDADLDVWTIDQDLKLTHVFDDLTASQPEPTRDRSN